ncbi:MAG: T9SS type A sorting domain-containing protein [Bacteroidales bacterium]|nr:T9SS type A sorting domain-containing protein [Bacteroidales bacterium]
MILGAGGTVNFTSTETIDLTGNLVTNSGSSITGTATGILNVGTNMQVLSGGTTTIGRLTMTVAGTTSISDTLELNVNTGIKTFVGKVSVNSGGAWLSTSVTTLTNLIFRDGITNNGASFEAGACTFNTNDQNLDGSTAMSFASAVRITGAITVTNQISDGITISGALTGSVAGSTWENDVNTVLYYRNAAAPMVTGVLSASASPNTVYYDLNGAQAVKGGTYDNLILSSGGAKTLNAVATVNDDLIINSGVSFNPAGYNFIVSDTTMIYGTFADGTAAGTTNLQYVELNGGTINGTATGVVNILDDFNIINGDGTIGRVALTVSGTTTIGSGRTLTLTSNTGVKVFRETLENYGTWISTTVTTVTNLIFWNGIINDGDLFSAGAATFTQNHQSITGSTALSFSANVTVLGDRNLRNLVSDGITISGVLNGTSAGSTWINDANSVLYYRNATMPMVNGGIQASFAPNFVFYDLNGNQTIKAAAYDNLILSTGGTKTLNTTTIVNDDFIINSGVTFNPSGLNFTVNDTTIIYGTFADATAAGTTNLQYTELNGGTINGGQTGVVNVLDDFDIINGDGTIGRVALTVSGITTIGSGRTLTLNSNTGVKVFRETLENNGTWISTTVTTATNLVFQNGIENNGDSFSAGAATFNTNNQEISGNTDYSFSSVIVIDGVEVLNNSTVTMTSTAAGTMSGSGSWVQAENSTLDYSGSTITINSFEAAASGNSIVFNRAGNQTVFYTESGEYFNIVFSTSGTKTLSSSIVVEGDLTISGTSVLAVGTYDINISGNWNNSSTAADPFTEATRTVTFDGTSAQTINNTGDSDGTSFYNLVIDNTYPDEAITLNTEVNVAGDLNMNMGHIVTDAVNILVLGTSATVTLGADPNASFVKGPMIHTFNVSASEVTKIFPIGKSDKMHRADLTIKQTNTTVTEYTAEFFYTGADSFGYSLPLTLDKVSEVAHWVISNGGATNINTGSVNLYYLEEDVIEDEPYLRIAKDDGAGAWIDLGGAGTASPAGNISSSVNFTSMSKFTLANAKDGENPLPIELLTFNASILDENVILSWTTSSEINNDYFTVERSPDAQNFETVTNVNGVGTSNTKIDYSITDYNPYSGVSYYRLKQTDFDGRFSYSTIVAVNILTKNGIILTAFQKENNLFLNIITDIIGKAELEIYDYTGKLLLNKIEFIENNETQLVLKTNNFKQGVYIIRLTIGTNRKTTKILII